MSKQQIIDETQLLQMHEGQAQHLLHLWQAGRIDLDAGPERNDHTIESALEELCTILDRSIRNRNKQVEDIENEPMDRFRRRAVK